MDEMKILEMAVYSLVTVTGCVVALVAWCGLVHILTRWERPWARVVSVSILSIILVTLAVLITSDAIREREARDGGKKKEQNLEHTNLP